MSAAAADRSGHLFDAELDTRAPLSRYHAGPDWQAATDRRPKWSAIKAAKPGPCDECAMVQHETRGAFGLRRQAKHRRAFPRPHAAAALRLCTQHADAWKDRDRAAIGTAADKPSRGRRTA